jgi:hypothetical protein
MSGEYDAYTRNGKTDHWNDLKFNEAPWVEGVLRMPVGTALDCELFVPGKQATDVITAIKERDSILSVSLFAVPWWAGQDAREWSFDRVSEVTAGNYHLELMETKTLSEVPAALTESQIAAMKRKATADGSEGWVVKLDHYSGWWKVKPCKTVDCVVMKTTMSLSESFAGGLKAVEVGVYDEAGQLVKIASVGTGFDADYRMTVDRKSLVGRVCEVSYDSLASKGMLKFPRFVRWREDKNAKECTHEQLC